MRRSLSIDQQKVLRLMATGQSLRCDFTEKGEANWRVGAAEESVELNNWYAEELKAPPRLIRFYAYREKQALYTLTPEGYRSIGLPVPEAMRVPNNRERLEKKIKRLETELAKAREELAAETVGAP